MSLVDIHDTLTSHDDVLEKEAHVEWEKLAEEDAAGRIMARGFMDELHKLAQGPPMAGNPPPPGPPQVAKAIKTPGTIPTKPGFDIGTGSTGAGIGKVTKRKPFAPPIAAAGASKIPFSAKKTRITTGGNIQKKQ